VAVVPNAAETLPLLYARNLLAGCAALRTWTGTATEALAKARIHYGIVTSPSGVTRPYAVVGEPESDAFRAALDSESNAFIAESAVAIRFVADIKTGDAAVATLGEQWLNFKNLVAAIMAEAMTLRGTTSAGGDPRLAFVGLNREAALLSNEDDEQDVPQFIEQVYMLQTDPFPVV